MALAHRGGHFSLNVARNKGKKVYLVDMPYYEMFRRILELPPKIKVRHLVSMASLRQNDPVEIDEITMTQRESYMLDEIVKREGQLARLTRKGILIVGYDHAVNYQKSIVQ